MTKRLIPNLRWYIAGLLCLSSELNYLDRQALAVLGETIQRDLHLTTVDYSYITSSFLVSYTIMYAISGTLIDRLGTRRGLAIFVSCWSIANALHGLARGTMQFAFYRFLLGVAEPANFPAGVKAVSEWFPLRERALAVGIFNAGTAVGAALAAPIVSFIALKWGWRYAFFVTGGLGFLWVLVWLLVYYLPRHHPRITPDEKDLILSASDLAAKADQHPVPVKKLLRLRETWGCILARVLTDPISYFLIFWIPKYLQQERGFTLQDIGKFGSIPFVALALGNIASGAIPHQLMKRGWSLNRARKGTMLVVSCTVPFCYLLITQVKSPAAALALITACMFGHAAWGNIILPAEVFSKSVVGTVTGFGGAFGGLAGILTQLTIGRVVLNLSFAPIFVACSIMYLIAFMLVRQLIGELGVIRTPEKP